MPGLYGVIAEAPEMVRSGGAMQKALGLGLAKRTESYEGEHAVIGCVHVDVGGQECLHISGRAAVAVFGHFTKPEIPPGAQADGRSAAEYLHDLYVSRGEAAAESIAGAFACAIWDLKHRKLLLISDHLGLRPLYYVSSRDGFSFASEPGALLVDGRTSRLVNEEAIADFFFHNYVMGDKTLYRDIKVVPPASMLTWHAGRLDVRKYYDLPYPESYRASSDNAFDDLIHETLGNAVRRIIRPGLRYGLSLSGGLDSRWLALLCRQYAPDLRTFTFGPRESDDVRLASILARRLGLPHEIVELQGSFIADHGETIARLSGGAYNLVDAQEFPLSLHMAGKVEVAFGGLLGDILFGHEMNPVYARLRRKDVSRYWMWRTQRARLPRPLAELVFGQQRSGRFLEMAVDSLNRAIEEAPCSHGHQIAQYVNLRQRQRRFINVAQTFKLGYVETSHPLADREVVEMAIQLPPRQLVMERAYRRSMVRAYPGLADLPWTLALLPPTASAAHVFFAWAFQTLAHRRLRKIRIGGRSLVREKKPFADYAGWSRTVLRPYIEEALLSPELESLGIFEPAGLRETVSRHMAGELNVTSFLGRAAALALWLRGDPGRGLVRSGEPPFELAP